MRLEQLVSSLVGHVGKSPGGDRLALLRALQDWVKVHVDTWSRELRDHWKLDELAAMDLSAYPVEASALDPDVAVRQLGAVRPSSMDQLAMRIRDVFWQGITVESEVTCPRCDGAALRILEEPASHAVVLSCDLCAWGQTAEGEPWHGAKTLGPASRSQVRRHQGA